MEPVIEMLLLRHFPFQAKNLWHLEQFFMMRYGFPVLYHPEHQVVIVLTKKMLQNMWFNLLSKGVS